MRHDPMSQKTAGLVGAPSRTNATAYVVLALAVAVVYSNALGHSFVYDDHLQIVQNPNIRSLSGLKIHFQAPHKVVGPFEEVENYPYRPLFWISLAIDYFAWGLRPFGYHLTNVALHGLNALLVFAVLVAALQARLLSLLTALLWALHPVHTEVVNPPSTRVVLLYALFYLLSLILFLRGTEPQKRNRLPWLVAAFLAFAFSLLSYEMAVTLPAVALLLDAARATRRGTPLGATVRGHAPFHLMFFTALLVYLLLRHLMLPTTGSPAAGLAHGLWPRVLRVPVILAADLSLLAFPKSLSIHRTAAIPRPHSLFEPDVLGSVLLLVLIGIALARMTRHCDVPSWGMGWFLLIESSVLNIVPIYRVAAERFLYLPSVGFLIAAVFSVGTLADRLALSRPQMRWRRHAACLCGAVVLLYSLRVIVRNRDWRDDVSLFRATVAASPGSLLAYLNLGAAYVESGQLALAEQAFSRAIELKADYAAAYYGLGLVYQRQGKLDRALAEFQRALAFNPRYVKAHLGLGAIYLQQGDLSRGIAELEATAEMTPSRAKVHHNLGLGYLKLGKTDQAITALQRAVELDPTNAAFYHTLGLAFQQAGKPDPARSAFQDELRRKKGPDER